MKNRKFLISSLAMAGFVKPSVGQATLPGDNADAAKGSLEPAVFNVFRQDHLFHLIGHSSHSSHASHASHASGGGGSYRPAPAYSPPIRAYSPAPLFSAPSSGGSYAPPVPAPATTPLRGGTELFNTVVRRVQLGLKAYGYYEGAIDGTVNPATKDALRRFQTDYKFKVTGTITPEVLDSLKIAAR